MREGALLDIARWVVNAGLAGRSEAELLTGLCERLREAGTNLARATAAIDTLHPVHEGRVAIWRRDVETKLTEYGSSDGVDSWLQSPFYRLLQTGQERLHRRLTAETEGEFPIFAELRRDGMTDYLVQITRFPGETVIGDMDCVYSSWVTDGPRGFSDEEVAAIDRITPVLALALKSTSLTRIARTLVETYLGRDAGQRVLRGRIHRGVADRIDAVLWFSDLRGFTRITDTAPPDQIIPLLNDYAEAVISSVQEQKGDVLKLIGDGVLAIFTADNRRDACEAALAAASAARQGLVALNERRAAAGVPVTDIYLGLHVGEVFYGNVGSAERLDFTVVGPAVNEVSRIAALCRSADQPVLISPAFAAALGDDRRLVSVGRFALRGVGRPQELFTLDPAGA